MVGLTCAHVVLNTSGAPVETFSDVRDSSKHICIRSVRDVWQDLDVATVVLDRGVPFSAYWIDGIGEVHLPMRGEIDQVIKDTGSDGEIPVLVAKWGAATGLTWGRLHGLVDGSSDIDRFGEDLKKYSQLWTIFGADDAFLSAGGDCGACWICADLRKPYHGCIIGLHVAGTEKGLLAFAIPLRADFLQSLPGSHWTE